MERKDIFWQTYLNLEKEAIELSKYIYFTDETLSNENGTIVSKSCNSQLATFSPYIADLLVRCCVEIEAITKELYYNNGGPKVRGDSSIHFDEDCLKLIDIKWKTHLKTVMIVAPFFNFTKEENRILKPLREAHKRQGTYWNRAYQAVKHDRYTSLSRGNVKAFLLALAALYLLNLYYRNDSWITSYNNISKYDYSMGSSIFSISPPVAKTLWYGNEAIVSESPYVVSYKDEAYQRISELQRQEEQALTNFISSQPEMIEPAFQKQITEALEREKNDPTQRVIGCWELGRYRINKKAPNSLPFDERKDRLIHCSEWVSWSNHPSVESITEENIQEIINSIGNRYGTELMMKFQKLEWLPIATNQEVCKVYIPQ